MKKNDQSLLVKNEAPSDEREVMLLLQICSDAGALLLRNGAEIYRVEDTMERIVRSRKEVINADAYSTFNVCMVSFNRDGKIYSDIRRVKDRSTNLYIVDQVNSFSRDFCNGKYSLEEALAILQKIGEGRSGKKLNTLGASLASAAFTGLVRGSPLEMLVAFFVGGLSWIIYMEVSSRKNLGYFLGNFFSGLVVSLLSLALTSLGGNLNIDTVIIGAMMPYLPGFSLTNAIRDLMGGDTTSGLTGLTQAILTTTALALGVALVLELSL